MSLKAKGYLFVVLASGISALLSNVPAFRPADPFQFGAYFFLALIASSLKVSLPGVTGTMSVLFLFVLIGIINLSLPETLVIGVAAVFAQSFWRAKKPPKLVHLGFNVASLIIAIKAAHTVYTAPIFLQIDALYPLRLAAAALTFFIGNTLTIAVIIALTENKSILLTWRTCYFWSLPYYIVGACFAGLFTYLTNVVGWQTSILLLPVMYWIYRSYRLYMDRLEQGRQHAQELQQAANRLNAVLESTTDLVLATNSEGKITYANQRARSRLFPEDPVGSILWETFPESVTGRFPQEVHAALSEKTPLNIEEEFFPALKAWFDIHAYPSAEGIALYLKDVTEERDLAEQLRQAQKMEAIGRLAGGVAHDFNNLLTIILGYGEVVAESVKKDNVCHAAMTEILRAGERASALTQRLLAFSRKQVLQPVVLDLNSVVSGIESMLSRLIGEDICINVKLDSCPCNVKADPNQLEQVVMNLAVNARDAMPDGGKLTITTDTVMVDASAAKYNGVAPGLFAVLSVADTGTGMDAETKARIFEPFFTTKDTGKGTGLGLATVYGIVQQSGGYVSVQSELGQGAIFQVYLPSVAAGDPAPRSEQTGMLQKGSGKILLVEDETAVRELARRMLTDAGYVVAKMDDQSEAMRLPLNELRSFDLLLTDVVMPGISGPDLAGELRKRHPGLKILYISGYSEHPLIGREEFASGVLLRKPFTKVQLLMSVEGVLRGELPVAAPTSGPASPWSSDGG